MDGKRVWEEEIRPPRVQQLTEGGDAMSCR